MFKSKLSKGFINIIAALVIGALAVIAGAFIDHNVQPVGLGSSNNGKVGAVNYVTGGGTYRLASSISSTQTSIKLSSFTEPISGTLYTMSYLNSALEYMTLDPQTNNSEFISFTGITQNSDGTATLTGITRGLGRSYPYTSQSIFQLTHSGQSIAILSNAPQLYNDIYSYINNVVANGAVPASPSILGLIQVATSGQAAINFQHTVVGATTTYYALTSDISSSTAKAGVRNIVVASSTGYIDPSFIGTSTLVNVTLNGTTTMATTTTIGSFPAWQIGKNMQVFSSTGTTTFSVPSGLTKVWVRMVGGGGGGGGSGGATNVGGGGGAGGYSEGPVNVTGTTSITIFVGGGGAGASGTGATGAISTFGPVGNAFMTANGGSGGAAYSGAGGNGGTASGGVLNITGGNGQGSFGNSTAFTSSGGALGGFSLFGSDGAYGSGGRGGSNSGNGSNGSQGLVIVSW